MANWISFTYKNQTNIGILEGDMVELFTGDMFNNPTTTGQKLSVNDIKLLNEAYNIDMDNNTIEPINK